MSVSLVASVEVNSVDTVNERAPVRPPSELLSSAISVIAAVRTYQLFPFDSSSYSRDSSKLVRVVVIPGIVGTSIAVLEGAELVPALLGNGPDRTA